MAPNVLTGRRAAALLTLGLASWNLGCSEDPSGGADVDTPMAIADAARRDGTASGGDARMDPTPAMTMRDHAVDVERPDLAGGAGPGAEAGIDGGFAADGAAAKPDTSPAGSPPSPAPTPPGAGGPATFDGLEAGDRAQDQFFEFPLDIGKDSGSVRCWLPGGIKVIRGMGINASQGSHAKEFARIVNFGLISFDGAYNPWPERLTMALQACGERGKHPELVNAVFVSSGHSRSTSPGGYSVTRIPERMVSSAPGGLPYAPPAGPSQKVPVMNWYGSRDGSQSKGNVENLERVRGTGALFGIAPHWGGGHVYGYGANLAYVFFAQTIALRYPTTQNPMAGPVKLRELAESDGWLGDRNGWIAEANGSGNFKTVQPHNLATIARFGDYKGDKTKAIWLPDSYTAHVWRAYVTPNDTVRMVFPNPQQSEQKAPLTMVEPGGVFTAKASVSGGPGAVKKVQLFDGDKLLGEATATPYEFPGIELPPGIHALIALATFEGGQMVSSRPATIYALRVPSCPPPTPDSFPISCVKKP